MPEDYIDPLESYMGRIGSYAKRLDEFLNSNAATHLIGNPNMPAETRAKLRAVLIPVTERISAQLADLVEFLNRAVEGAEKLPGVIEEWERKLFPQKPQTPPRRKVKS